MNRIRSGHAMTSEYKHRIKVPGQDSPLGDCGGGTGDVDHLFLFHCRSHSTARLGMIESIELLYQHENVPPYLRTGLLGFMGHGDSWGFIFTHESTLGFMDRTRIL